MFGLFACLFQYLFPLLLQRFHFSLIAGDGFLHLFFALTDILAFSLPVTLITDNVLQILVTLDVFAAHDFRCIGDDILGQAYLTGNLHSKRTARITYLQLEKGLHQVTVVKHGTVHHTFMVFGKMFQVLVMGRNDTEGHFLIEPFQHRLGNGTAYLRLRSSTKFINENQTSSVALFHHNFHVRQVRRIGTQVVLYRLLITNVNKDTTENSRMAAFVHRNRQTTLQHILKQTNRFQTDRLSTGIWT